MSDLAPFVAAVLKDRTMVDMMAEMEKLKNLVDDRFKVQITGNKGSPVYFEGSLKDGYTTHRGRCFEVMFDDNDKSNKDTAKTTTSSPSRALHLKTLNDSIEIRLGGIIIEQLDLHNVVGSCNAPFFTDNDFYRDTKYNRPYFLEPDRKEIVLKVKSRHKGPVPFVLARFGKEMSIGTYRKLHQVDMAEMKALVDSKKNYTLILDGITFSKPYVKQSLAIVKSLGYSIDENNSHCRTSTVITNKVRSQEKNQSTRHTTAKINTVP